MKDSASPRTVELPLSSRWRAMAFLLAVALPVVAVTGESLRVAAALVLTDSSGLPHLRQALQIDPGNPETHHKLGLYYSHSPEDLDARQAAEYFRRATELSPLKAAYWSDLAEACESAGDDVCADESFSHAVKLSPMAARFHWASALHYLATGHADEALGYFRRVLELDPGYSYATFRLCPGALENPETILRRVLPERGAARPKLDYINFLTAHGRDGLASRVWTEAAVNASPFPLAWAAPYLDHLLGLGRARDAEQVWQDLERLGVVQKPPVPEPGELLFNGGFERPPLNAGFDWRFEDSPYLSIDPENRAASSGEHCLRVDFTVGRNDEIEPAYQFVSVAPRETYLLSAHVRSDSIASDSGPRLRVLDPQCPACLSESTSPTVATTPWHPVSLTFSTGADTRLIRLSVWRSRTRSFPTEITGTFWLDAVSLKPVGAGRGEVAQER